MLRIVVFSLLLMTSAAAESQKPRHIDGWVSDLTKGRPYKVELFAHPETAKRLGEVAMLPVAADTKMERGVLEVRTRNVIKGMEKGKPAVLANPGDVIAIYSGPM